MSTDPPSSSDFFAQRLLDELKDKPALEGALEALLASRAVGFDYASDEEAVRHFESEAAEIAHAFRHESRQAAIDESGDMLVIWSELIRRRGDDVVSVARRGAEKFLRRLAYVEEQMAVDGKTWQTVGPWKGKVLQDYWNRAKAAGL